MCSGVKRGAFLPKIWSLTAILSVSYLEGEFELGVPKEDNFFAAQTKRHYPQFLFSWPVSLFFWLVFDFFLFIPFRKSLNRKILFLYAWPSDLILLCNN